MLEYRPFVPISHGIRVSTAILSYNGRLYFGITGDYETAADVDVLASRSSEGHRASSINVRVARLDDASDRGEPIRQGA